MPPHLVDLNAVFMPTLPIPPATEPIITSPLLSGTTEADEFHQSAPSTSSSGSCVIHSPFRDCIGTFGTQNSQFFSRPQDGKVNSYVKFSWPKESPARQRSIAYTSPASDDSGVIELEDVSETAEECASQSSSVTVICPPTPNANREATMIWALDVAAPPGHTGAGIYSYSAAPCIASPPILTNKSMKVANMGAPRLIPSQYGYEAKMDVTDRRFWMFYIRNWCPGRSVLEGTNLWLKDFAQMHKSVGVRAAIQSLAGIYIYDYQPLDSIRSRVNERFSQAEERLTALLNDPKTYRDEAQANELISIAVILSMQDIVLTERRLKNPHTPRWLQGFRRGEQFLQATDHGSRFWRSSNIQTSSLRISQSVIVGRAIILAQPMALLPPPNEFDAEKEASRFGWLLYGTERDMYQIHGGCGFSKKLLHILSQVTYCAARLQQEAESPIVPMTAQYVYAELDRMRQWSPESKDWESAKASPLVIEWVRMQPPDYVIVDNPTMTDVTAEAWRITAILYLLCRVFRLPRNHPEVISQLDDLSRCIIIMPTSGMQFTAQAPLFPVFLLGVLATLPEHKAVSSTWFNEVLQAPVRSSVPPLHDALQHICSWIDEVIPLPSPSILDPLEPIHHRPQWWETLVTTIHEQEQEVLCLT